MDNIIDKYISNVQKKLRRYNNLVLKSRYDKNISDVLIQTYIDARYYNYGTNDKIKFFYRKIYDALKRKGEVLIKKEPRKKELIDNMVSIFQYYFYFDFVRKTNDLEKIVKSIAEKRIFKLGLKSAVDDKNFEEEFLQMVKDDISEVKEFLVSYDSRDFSLEQKRFVDDNNYCDISLKYYFDFPEIFSQVAIDEVFNHDVIAEDRLFVEYPLVSIEALKDIINGDFNKIYLCDFAASLCSKRNKINQVIQIIDNQAAQDKMYLKVSYNDYLDHKESIFNLVRKGFKFALKTNGNMPKLSSDELRLLEIFSCIIVDKNDVNKYKNVKIIQK